MKALQRTFLTAVLLSVGASAPAQMRGGLQLGPPGRFWNDRSFAQTLGLRKDQQKKMDAIFGANKTAIVESFKAFQQEEKRLEAATKEKHPDESKIFAGIDAVAQARGNLEKAHAHMLLLIRDEMDPDQIARMEKFREGLASEEAPQ